MLLIINLTGWNRYTHIVCHEDGFVTSQLALPSPGPYVSMIYVNTVSYHGHGHCWSGLV